MPKGKVVFHCVNPDAAVDALFEPVSESSVVWIPAKSPDDIMSALAASDGVDESTALAHAFNVDMHHDMRPTPVVSCVAMADCLPDLAPVKVPQLPANPPKLRTSAASSMSAKPVTRGVRKAVKGSKASASREAQKKKNNRAAAAKVRARIKEEWQDSLRALKRLLPCLTINEPIELFKPEVVRGVMGHLKNRKIIQSYRLVCKELNAMGEERDRTYGRLAKNSMSAKICRHRRTKGNELVAAMVRHLQK